MSESTSKSSIGTNNLLAAVALVGISSAAAAATALYLQRSRKKDEIIISKSGKPPTTTKADDDTIMSRWRNHINGLDLHYVTTDTDEWQPRVNLVALQGEVLQPMIVPPLLGGEEARQNAGRPRIQRCGSTNALPPMPTIDTDEMAASTLTLSWKNDGGFPIHQSEMIPPIPCDNINVRLQFLMVLSKALKNGTHQWRRCYKNWVTDPNNEFHPLDYAILLRFDLPTIERLYDKDPTALSLRSLFHACLYSKSPGVIGFLAKKKPEYVSMTWNNNKPLVQQQHSSSSSSSSSDASLCLGNMYPIIYAMSLNEHWPDLEDDIKTLMQLWPEGLFCPSLGRYPDRGRTVSFERFEEWLHDADLNESHRKSFDDFLLYIREWLQVSKNVGGGYYSDDESFEFYYRDNLFEYMVIKEPAIGYEAYLKTNPKATDLRWLPKVQPCVAGGPGDSFHEVSAEMVIHLLSYLLFKNNRIRNLALHLNDLHIPIVLFRADFFFPLEEAAQAFKETSKIKTITLHLTTHWLNRTQPNAFFNLLDSLRYMPCLEKVELVEILEPRPPRDDRLIDPRDDEYDELDIRRGRDAVSSLELLVLNGNLQQLEIDSPALGSFADIKPPIYSPLIKALKQNTTLTDVTLKGVCKSWLECDYTMDLMELLKVNTTIRNLELLTLPHGRNDGVRTSYWKSNVRSALKKSKKDAFYFLKLNQCGRKMAVDPATTPEDFVRGLALVGNIDLDVRVAESANDPCDTIDITKLQFGLLLDGVNIWTKAALKI